MSPSEAQHKHVTGRIGNSSSQTTNMNSNHPMSVSVSTSYDNAPATRNSSSSAQRLSIEEEMNDPYISSGGTYGSSPIHKVSFEHRRTPWQQCCAVGMDWDEEYLKYNYTLSERDMEQQPLPRSRDRGEYYIDSYNMEKWNCSFGTLEEVKFDPLYMKSIGGVCFTLV